MCNKIKKDKKVKEKSPNKLKKIDKTVHNILFQLLRLVLE